MCVYVQNVDDDASIHDKLLWAIHMSGLDDLLKFLACAQSEQQWSFHILEIISLMFRDQVTYLNNSWCTESLLFKRTVQTTIKIVISCFP